MKRLLLVALLGVFLISCNRDDRSEAEMIDDFIAENNLQGEFMDNGIFVSIENPGSGTHPNQNNTVEVYYEGKYVSDGEVFDGNLGSANPISFSLQGVIPGWTVGIPYFGVGDKGWLVLPASWAYGSFPPNGIRNNAPMAFYIELVSIK